MTGTGTQIEPVHYGFECGDATWRVLRFSMEEELDRLPEVWLQLASTDVTDPARLLDTPAAFTLTRGDLQRVVHGEVTRIEILGRASGLQHVRVRVESQLARGRRSRRPRIFEDRTVPEIAGEIVAALGSIAIERRLAGSYATRGYCVQYDETDLAFLHRLLEEEGISLVVGDDGTQETLMLADAPEQFHTFDGPDGPSIAVVAGRGEFHECESISRMTIAVRSATSQVIQRDWDWHEGAVAEAVAGHQPSGHGLVLDSNDQRGASGSWDRRARLKHEAAGVDQVVVRGSSNVIGMRAGLVIEVDDRSGAPRRLRVLSVRHAADCPEADPVASRGNVGTTYTNEFSAVLASVPQRPLRRTPRPRVPGIHTAVVTGPPGEEVHTDAHGRIRVRMHWDRSGSSDDRSSCWLAVAQSFAGPGWGAMFLPRIGMEVLVAFLDGDPDRPICVGCVYNGANTPPYPLPDHKTKTTLRTQSSPGGDGFNELTFEDRAGGEQIYVHAQRDMDTTIRRNESRSVGSDQSIRVGHDQSTSVGGDQALTVTGNQRIAIDGGGTQGLAGTDIAVKGAVQLKVTEPGSVVIEADEEIVLKVMGTSITLDGHSIHLQAGDGTMARFDLTAVLIAAGGAMSTLSSSASMVSAAGTSLELSSNAELLSSGGSELTLSDEVSLTAAKGAKLGLDDAAAVGGVSVTAQATDGSSMVLDATKAELSGQEMTCSGAAGSLVIGATGAALDGTNVDVTAMAQAQLIGALVKIN